MGTQTWVAITIIFTELLIVLKFDWDVVTIPFPRHVAICWSIAITLFVLWIIWQFYLKPHLYKANEYNETTKKTKKSK